MLRLLLLCNYSARRQPPQTRGSVSASAITRFSGCYWGLQEHVQPQSPIENRRHCGNMCMMRNNFEVRRSGSAEQILTQPKHFVTYFLFYQMILSLKVLFPIWSIQIAAIVMFHCLAETFRNSAHQGLT